MKYLLALCVLMSCSQEDYSNQKDYYLIDYYVISHDLPDQEVRFEQYECEHNYFHIEIDSPRLTFLTDCEQPLYYSSYETFISNGRVTFNDIIKIGTLTIAKGDTFNVSQREDKLYLTQNNLSVKVFFVYQEI